MFVGLFAIAATAPIGKEFSWSVGEFVCFVIGVPAFVIGFTRLVSRSLAELALTITQPSQQTIDSHPMKDTVNR